MSLTRHLQTRSSPLRAWFAERLPHTAALVREANHALRGRDPVLQARIGRPTVAPLSSVARTFGPTFALSQQLGGADADLIADGLLLDFKATSTTRIVTRDALWQLIGYALADTHDEHRVTTVGVSALRWRRRWVCQLEDLLNIVGGTPVAIADMRAEFATVVGSLRRGRGRPPGERRFARYLTDHGYRWLFEPDYQRSARPATSPDFLVERNGT